MDSREPVPVPEGTRAFTGTDDLRDREKTVLQELARADGGRIAFQALRRRLGLHPQALTRTLRSLESAGWIRRDDLGYRVVDPNAAATELPATVERMPVFAALVPPHLLPRQIVDQLRQRWFHGLRWFGLADTPTETILTWTTELDGRPVRLRVSDKMIGVELEGNEANHELASVAPLMQALSVLYGRGRSTPDTLSGPAQ